MQKARLIYVHTVLFNVHQQNYTSSFRFVTSLPAWSASLRLDCTNDYMEMMELFILPLVPALNIWNNKEYMAKTWHILTRRWLEYKLSEILKLASAELIHSRIILFIHMLGITLKAHDVLGFHYHHSWRLCISNRNYFIKLSF